MGTTGCLIGWLAGWLPLGFWILHWLGSCLLPLTGAGRAYKHPQLSWSGPQGHIPGVRCYKLPAQCSSTARLQSVGQRRQK